MRKPTMLFIVGRQIGAAAAEADAQRGPGDDHAPELTAFHIPVKRQNNLGLDSPRRAAP
jgi:hypothetical protein